MDTNYLREWGMDVSVYLDRTLVLSSSTYHPDPFCDLLTHDWSRVRLTASQMESGVSLCDICWHSIGGPDAKEVRGLLACFNDLNAWEESGKPLFKLLSRLYSAHTLPSSTNADVCAKTLLVQKMWQESLEACFPMGRAEDRRLYDASLPESPEVLLTVNAGKDGPFGVWRSTLSLSEEDSDIGLMYADFSAPTFTAVFRGPEVALKNLQRSLLGQEFMNFPVSVTYLQPGDNAVISLAYDLLEVDGPFADMGRALETARSLI